MKKIILLLLTPALLLAVVPAFCQTYKTAADTSALNTEYLKVSKDIADISAKLDKAKQDQDADTRKANKSTAEAQTTAASASDKAAQSVDGTVKEAKRAKREARRSVRDAKDSRRAQGNLDDSGKKVSDLTSDLAKKQERLKQLDDMRASITAQ
jgi:F0F1-type ATP synthase membrane subunit b/b'